MISVIIPVYNVVLYLDQCIQSILSQTYKDFECILIDDGSSDGSAQICDKWACKDLRVRVVHQNNQGVSAARNKGIEEAKGEYIAFVDSDDWVEESYLESLLLNMSNENCDLSVLGITANYKDGSIKCSSYQNVSFRLDSSGLKHFLKLEGLYLLFGPSPKLYKKSIIQDHNISFNPQYSYGEDLLFNYEYLKYVRVISNCNMPIYHYRILNGDNLATKPRRDYFDINYKQWHVLKDFHIEKGLYSKDTQLFLYDRLWGMVYDSIFLIRKFKQNFSISDMYNYLRNILKIPEISDDNFRQQSFECSSWLKFLILHRCCYLLVLFFYIKK